MTETPRDHRVELAAMALGRLDDAERRVMEQRLEIDAELRRELAELRALVDLLSLVDGEHWADPGAPPPELERSVVEAVTREKHRTRRRSRVRWAIVSGLAAAAVVLVFVLAIGVMGDEDAPTPSAFERTSEGAEGRFVIEPQPWGTEIVLDVAGLTRGEVYWLWLSDADGNRSGAGTFRGNADDQRLTMSSALPVAQAARIWVTDEDDSVVLDSFLR